MNKKIAIITPLLFAVALTAFAVPMASALVHPYVVATGWAVVYVNGQWVKGPAQLELFFELVCLDINVNGGYDLDWNTLVSTYQGRYFTMLKAAQTGPTFEPYSRWITVTVFGHTGSCRVVAYGQGLYFYGVAQIVT